ncbi:MAG: twin-arginine translocase subunit TatC [Deltaproteobacteria bacterium]|nr:twin-arginine translocase subunit TatC [Deltaproteobacteria bacterium]
MDQSKYTLTEHLTELRARMIKGALGVLLTTGVALFFASDLLTAAVAPLQDILRQKNRVETVLVQPDAAKRSQLKSQLEDDPRVALRGDVATLAEAVAIGRRLAGEKKPLDLLLIAQAAIDGEAADALEGLEPAPSVAYLVPDARDPRIAELSLEGASVLLDPPKKAMLSRALRRAAATSGKVSSSDKLVVLSPLEPFFAYLKIALVVGLFLACPIWLFQAWRFIEPGLYAKERAFVLPVVLSGSALFIGGGAFAYFLMFPLMFDVLINQMMPAELTGSFTVDNYLSLLLTMTVVFGIVFELPLIIALLAGLGFITPQALIKFRKYWLILAFVIGAILTPADPLSQSMMAVPLVIFYEVGIIAAKILTRRREQRLTEIDRAPSS